MRDFSLRRHLRWTLFLLLGLALPGVALADDNVLHIVQNGTTNAGDIVQSGLGNQAGTIALPLEQNGVFDDLVLTQSGDDNTIGLGGRGLVQTGTASTDGSPANSATILQNSDGNVIGELVQTTLGVHGTTGNTLGITQDKKGTNTIGSAVQVQDSGAAANVAEITQTGFRNWIDQVSQHTTSGEADNHIVLTVTGDDNGIDTGSLAGAGSLAVLARSSGAAPSQIRQDGDLSGGAQNVTRLAITGDFNQFGVTQLGVDNSVAESITGSGNSFGTYQQGEHNQIASGGIAGDGNDLGIRQLGSSNIATAVLNWSSSDNEVGIGQIGDSNTADLAMKGDHGLVGISQDGRGHVASIDTVGDRNVILAMQVNAGRTSSVGDSLTVSVNGDGNNGLDGISAAAFSGAALEASLQAPALSRALLVTPDATLLVASLDSGLTLVPGMLAQLGEGDRMDISVGASRASDGNFFAVLQSGSGQSVTARVNGNANQFAVVQVNDDDTAVVSQDGDNNVAGIIQ
jgi:hypothetical protein